MQLNNNAALLGGGLYLAADLSQDVDMKGLAFQSNFGLLGAYNAPALLRNIALDANFRN